MWTDVLEEMFEREVERRVHERMEHMGCGGDYHGGDHHGDDHGPDRPSAEWYWGHVTEDMGMSMDMFIDLAY